MLFFFFKQKTAYEMRISDWSSDVCSSDLRSSETAQVFFDDVRVPQRNRIGQEGAGFMMQMLQFQEERLFGAANMLKGLEHCIDSTIAYCKEIGRASCRERVCQYV